MYQNWLTQKTAGLPDGSGGKLAKKNPASPCLDLPENLPKKTLNLMPNMVNCGTFAVSFPNGGSKL